MKHIRHLSNTRFADGWKMTEGRKGATMRGMGRRRLDGFARALALLVSLGMGAAAALAEELDSRSARAKLLAKESSHALITQDFNRVVDLTYPLVVEKIGGRTKMVEMLAAGTKNMAASGFTFRAVEVQDPTGLATAGKQLFTIVPTVTEMAAPGGRLKVTSYLIGISDDKGGAWTFIDGANLTLDKVKTVLANFPDSLQLPAKEEPAFEKTN